MTDWYIGTIGFTYPEWRGTFYPAGLPSGQSLGYYSKIYNAVEINTTFYGPQSPAKVQRWASATPVDFRFCLKAPRRVTHDLRLKNAEAEMRVFVESSQSLGDKFGAVLVQLPPSLKVNERPALERFLDTLPPGPRYAIEFRHASWHIPQTVELLRAHGVCWVATDYEDLPVEIYPTTDFLYIRWIGKHGVLPHQGYEILDRTERLKSWLERVEAAAGGLHTVYGFFDNDYAGHAPVTANRLKALLGLPVTPAPGEEQGRLF